MAMANRRPIDNGERRIGAGILDRSLRRVGSLNRRGRSGSEGSTLTLLWRTTQGIRTAPIGRFRIRCDFSVRFEPIAQSRTSRPLLRSPLTTHDAQTTNSPLIRSIAPALERMKAVGRLEKSRKEFDARSEHAYTTPCTAHVHPCRRQFGWRSGES